MKSTDKNLAIFLSLVLLICAQAWSITLGKEPFRATNARVCRKAQKRGKVSERTTELMFFCGCGEATE